MSQTITKALEALRAEGVAWLPEGATAVLTVPYEITDAEAAEIKRQWDEATGCAPVVVLSGGMTLQVLTHDSM